MAFWKLAYDRKWVTAEELRQAVLTAENPYGEITPEEYEIITSIPF